MCKLTVLCCVDETDKYFYVLFSHEIYLDNNYFLQRSWTRLVYRLTLPYCWMKVGWVICASFLDNTCQLINGIVCFNSVYVFIPNLILSVSIKWMFTCSMTFILLKIWRLLIYTIDNQSFPVISSTTFQPYKPESKASCDGCQNANSYHLSLA